MEISPQCIEPVQCVSLFAPDDSGWMDFYDTSVWGSRTTLTSHEVQIRSFKLSQRFKKKIGVANLTSAYADFELSLPPLIADAFVASVSMGSGSVTLLDLRQIRNICFEPPFDLVQFYFSRESLNAILEEQCAEPIEALCAPLGVPRYDERFHQMALSLISSFRDSGTTNSFFVDHVLLAAAAHITSTCTNSADHDRFTRGGLAPWQKNRAQQIMDANIGNRLSIALLATECCLSVRHFTRAFTQSMGVSPHRWLLQRRLGIAKDFLITSDLSLREIALKTGFADQSHFTKVFSQSMGMSPGVWRRFNAERRVPL